MLIDFIVLDFNIKFMTSQINYYTIYIMVISKDIQTQGVNNKMKAYNTCSKVEIGINWINCGPQLTFCNDPQCKDNRCQLDVETTSS